MYTNIGSIPSIGAALLAVIVAVAVYVCVDMYTYTNVGGIPSLSAALLVVVAGKCIQKVKVVDGRSRQIVVRARDIPNSNAH